MAQVSQVQELPLERAGAAERGAGDARSSEAPREDNAKQRQILDGARSVFMADGFDGASMNEIARRAGVSKGTLYVYFDSKEALFEALIRTDKRQQAEQLCRFDAEDHDLEATLNGFGLRFLKLMLRPDSIAHLRTVLAVATKFPGVGRAYYESGPGYGFRRLAAYFDAQVAAGILDCRDTETVAMHFLELCKSRFLLQMLLGVAPQPDDAELAGHVATATATLLRAYGLRPR